MASVDNGWFKNVKITILPSSITAKCDNSSQFSGYGVIRNAPEKIKHVIGNRAFFSVKSSECDVLPVVGQEFVILCDCSRTKHTSKQWFFRYLRDSCISWSLSKGHLVECIGSASALAQTSRYLLNNFLNTLSIGSAGSTSEAGILNGMLTGMKSSIEQHDSVIFKDFGLCHLFAVSGIHVGTIILTINFILSAMLVPKRPRMVIVFILVYFYVHAIGASQSSVRAMTMSAFYFCCAMAWRCPSVLPALVDSALLNILIDPFVVFNISFLLSYSVVCGIVLIGVPLQNLLSKNFLTTYGLKRSALSIPDRLIFQVKAFLISAFSISFSAYISGIPFSVETFGTLPLLTVPVGIVAVPMASCAIIFGAISLLFGLLNMTFACFILNKISLFIIKLMNLVLNTVHSDWCCLKNVHLPIFSGATFTAILLAVPYAIISYANRKNDTKHPPKTDSSTNEQPVGAPAIAGDLA